VIRYPTYEYEFNTTQNIHHTQAERRRREAEIHQATENGLRSCTYNQIEAEYMRRRLGTIVESSCTWHVPRAGIFVFHRVKFKGAISITMCCTELRRATATLGVSNQKILEESLDGLEVELAEHDERSESHVADVPDSREKLPSFIKEDGDEKTMEE